MFVRSTPLLTSQPGEQRSGRDGRARLRMRPTANFPLNDDRNVQFFVRVRKASDLLLAGVSNRRIVQVATAAERARACGADGRHPPRTRQQIAHRSVSD